MSVREYVADKASSQLKNKEESAERNEEIAGIIYDLQHPKFNGTLSADDIAQIKAIINKEKTD